MSDRLISPSTSQSRWRRIARTIESGINRSDREKRVIPTIAKSRRLGMISGPVIGTAKTVTPTPTKADAKPTTTHLIC